MTVTCHAGVVWEKVDAALNKEGLTVKSLSVQLSGSTVGGWLAQGGAGFGSYQYGWFREMSFLPVWRCLMVRCVSLPALIWT